MFKKSLLALVCASFLMGESSLNFVMSNNVGPLNPHLYSPNEMFAQDMVYEGLTKYDENGIVSMQLAKNVDIKNDGKKYIFILRDDVSFSDGEKFDAEAVKANFDAIMANKDRHKWLELSNVIENVKVISKYEIEINLKHAYEPTLRELSLIRPFRFISPKSLINGGSKDGITKPAGTGAFVLESSQLGVSDTFVPNKNYWGEKPKYDKIIGKVIPNPSTKILALKTGEADLIYVSEQIPLDVLDELKKSFNVSFSNPIKTLAIAINSNKFPSNDLSVRKAINLAVDKDIIVKSVFFGTQTKADFLFDTKLPFCDTGAKAYEFDPKKANEILAMDGWVMKDDGFRYKNDKMLNLELVYIGSNAAFKSIAEILQAQLKNVGIKLDLKADESSIFYKKQRTGDFHLVFNSTWGVPYEPEMFLASMRSPSHADYQAQVGIKQKPMIDENISKILVTFDTKEKDTLIKSILTTLHEEAIYLPISHQTNIAISSKKIGGVKAKGMPNVIPFGDMYPVK